MAKKARLSELNTQLRAVADSKLDPNPEDRSDFVNTTIRLPEHMLVKVQALGRERRRRGEPNRTVSAIVREALAALLSQKQG